ncbi:hypothetical protein [uncultured Parasutterella sp.]|uniref:hypothetical protein n=3 Tax=uncultured Parasutterella sp. TaxID=1263098 RepID=UPI002591CD71|nr:hypothetical protein [uncultured Parasutterella sp.]
MWTKNDYKQKIADSISKYPAIAALFEVNDPRIMQHLDAIATMLAMQSAQIEVAQNEPFQKTRDSTVLADAAMRGIVPKATATRALIKVTNKSGSAFSVETGRNLLDSMGRLWVIATPAQVEADGGIATFEAVQSRTETIKHTVSESEPFYSIEIPQSEDEDYLCALDVSDADGPYEYRDRYVNTEPGERVYHVEADDRQRIYCRFGVEDVVGVQLGTGTELTLSVSYSFGAIDLEAGSPFSLEYTYNESENNLDFSLSNIISLGQNPIEFSVLKDLARYPSIYDSNAVFLGEFDFLVRRNFPTLQFLSVWNETLEEQVRGSSIDNINCLFIACLSADGSEKTSENLTEEIEVEDLTGTQRSIVERIKAADDSYRVRFFTPVISPIEITVTARVSTSYVATEIKEKIIEALLSEYGKEAACSRRGQNRILYRRVYSLLREKVPALTEGESDMTVVIKDYDTQASKPELWRFVDKDSLNVSVSTANITTPSWG